MKRIIVALLLLSTVSACAVPISSGDMKPVTEAQIAISPNQKLAGKLAVGNVQVGDEAKVYGAITPDAYKDALQSALLSSNYLTRGAGQNKYTIDATLQKMDYPAVGFNLDCYATATYRMRNSVTGEAISTETVKSHYLAKFGESFDGNIRMRLCLAKAIRENITHYLRILSQS